MRLKSTTYMLSEYTNVQDTATNIAMTSATKPST